MNSAADESAVRLRDVLRAGRIAGRHRPWPRALVGNEIWRQAASLLAGGEWTLSALWADGPLVHMAVIERGERAGDASAENFGVLSVACQDKRFPSIGASHPPAIRLERALRDLWLLHPEGLADTRPWLDHGQWNRPQPSHQLHGSDGYPFLPVEGESLHQIPVGPVHAGIIEPGHFRFTANGETVVRLEQRLGYVHKGIEHLMTGAPLERAAILAGRVSGDSTVAYALAFARAVEAALSIEVPARAVWLRALMAELERLANHLGDFGAICNDASFVLLHAQCGYLREQVLRAADQCFGHRLMMDRIVPGGVRSDLLYGAGRSSNGSKGSDSIATLLRLIRRRFPELVELYDRTASLQDRTVGTGILAPALARRFGCGGVIGRASGRRFDARRTPGYPPYDELQFEVPVLDAGDVDARVWIRIREVEQSLALIEQILARLQAMGGPPAAAAGAADSADRRADMASTADALGRPIDSAAAGAALAAGEAREGVALAEGFRGDVLAWVRIGADGKIERCHLRDPSWFQWPLLEAVIEGNIVADFPLCNKSFNCSYSGHDL